MTQAEGEATSRAESLFCYTTYQEGRTFFLVTAHILCVCCLVVLAVLIYKYYQRRDYSPIRERAARLSIVQMLGFYSLFAIQYITEVMFSLGLDWSSPSNSDVPWSRDLNKSLYMSVRILTYLLFVLRYSACDAGSTSFTRSGRGELSSRTLRTGTFKTLLEDETTPTNMDLLSSSDKTNTRKKFREEARQTLS